MTPDAELPGFREKIGKLVGAAQQRYKARIWSRTYLTRMVLDFALSSLVRKKTEIISRRELFQSVRGPEDHDDVRQDWLISFWSKESLKKLVSHLLKQQPPIEGQPASWKRRALGWFLRHFRRRVGKANRKHAFQRRDTRRNQSLENDPEVDGQEKVVELEDLLAHMLMLLDPFKQQILKLLLKGYTNVEIAAQLGCSPRTVSRHLTELRCDQRLAPLFDQLYG